MARPTTSKERRILERLERLETAVRHRQQAAADQEDMAEKLAELRRRFGIVLPDNGRE
jgi:hypothetical protein